MTGRTVLTAGLPPTEGSKAGDRVRFVLRGIGQTLITLGVVVGLFIVYEVWISNWFSERTNKHLVQRLEQSWARPSLPDSGPSTVAVGGALGVLYVPRLGRDFNWAIVQGSTVPNQDQLAKGPAHYGATALPGQLGNFAVAGHRVGRGEPFLDLDHLRPGDAVVVETRAAWYVYRVKGVDNGLTQLDADDIPGREIVGPSDGSVLLPVPDHPGRVPTEKLMTMTTCTPKFTAQKRMVVFARLDETVAWTGNTMPARVAALYSEVY